MIEQLARLAVRNRPAGPAALARVHPAIDAADAAPGDLRHRVNAAALLNDGSGWLQMHESQIALIAISGQAAICDLRDSVPCDPRNNPRMNERDRIRNWLKALLDSAPRGTKSQLADAMGIRREALSRMISGTGEAREVTAVELARAGEFFRVPLHDFRGSRDAPPTVPLISWVSAGRLAESSQAPRAERLLAMPDLGSGDFFALTVKGDSMDRISPDGSIIVVNRREQQLVAGKAYVFAIKGEATYKLWRPGPPARLEPYSTNPMNEPIFPERRKLFVVGRVRRTLLDL